MFFTVVAHPRDVPTGPTAKAFLVENNWDDWGKFETVFQLVVFDHEGKRYDPGYVKIGHFGLRPGAWLERAPGVRIPTPEPDFDALNESYFSLGRGENYYENLNELPDDLRLAVLRGLRDCALDLQLFDQARAEPVMQDSLLRDQSEENVRNRLHRLARGDAELTEFKFEYIFPKLGEDAPPVLTFEVQPHSRPPTNVHVIIGRNGVGKTRCLHYIAGALSGVDEAPGEFRQLGRNRKDWTLAGMVFISFSAFDNFDLPKAEKSEMRSEMIGLRQRGATTEVVTTVKTPEELASDFGRSFEICREGLRRERWRTAIQTLENDPLFAEADVTALLDRHVDEWQSAAQSLFRGLSSGHAIVLLTITRLVELVDERTLVLFDEPEGHLHPPLLSAFIRSLADLLIKRNGVAIIATHSPVVLQEVPKSCVWMLRRAGDVSVAERPAIETFGENVGVLTREVFGLEVTTAGFHHMVSQAVEADQLNYDGVLTSFEGQLGAEARAIARGLVANRDAKQ
jgi:ABC-type transport system involved in cytochrome c biogenesis ATPase subunit